MQQTDPLADQLEQTRSELLELSARVQRLIGKRSQRQVLLQRLHRSATMSPTAALPAAHHLCSLCATSYASMAIEHVRGIAPGLKCDHCGQPAIVWIQLKLEPEEEHESAADQ